MNLDKFEKMRFNFDKKRLEKICKSLNYNLKKQGINVDFHPNETNGYNKFRITNRYYNSKDPNTCVFQFCIKLKDFYVVDNFIDIFKSNLDKEIEIQSFFIKTQHIGNGTKSINAFKKTFKSLNFKEINLYANDPLAIKFWEKQGFIRNEEFGHNLTFNFK